MAEFKKITGACFCGENQFEVSEPAVDSHHCHCSICRRIHGAPVVTWSIFPRRAVKWTKGGDLHKFASSNAVSRYRCKNCGSPLTAEVAAMPNELFVNRANFSDLNADPGHPKETWRHAFWPDRVPWLDISDNLPKVEGFK